MSCPELRAVFQVLSCQIRTEGQYLFAFWHDFSADEAQHYVNFFFFFCCCCYRALQICNLTCCPLSCTVLIWSLPFSKSTSLLMSWFPFIFPHVWLTLIILSWFSFSLLVPTPNLSGLYCICLSTATGNGRSYSCFCSLLFIFSILWSLQPLVLVCSLPPCNCAPCSQMISSRAALCLVSVVAREESPWPDKQRRLPHAQLGRVNAERASQLCMS